MLWINGVFERTLSSIVFNMFFPSFIFVFQFNNSAGAAGGNTAGSILLCTHAELLLLGIYPHINWNMRIIYILTV